MPCRNEVAGIAEVVRSAAAQEGAGTDFRLELLVADGMSDDGTREVLAELAASLAVLRVVDNPRRIASTGLNIGIAAATGDYIVRMDAHTEYASDYVQQCLSAIDATDAANVGGPGSD